MANENEKSDKMKTQESAAPPMVYKSPPLTARGRREARRQRAAKAAAKAPDWAQSIWKLEQASETFSNLSYQTERFARKKGYELYHARVGYDLSDDDDAPVLRGRPMFVIVEYLGAQDIWKDFTYESKKSTAPPKVYNSPPLTPREARSITADGKTAPKVPDWAQSIGKFQQASETFSRLRHNTEDFAETKGYKLRHAGSGFGYNLDSYGGPVLRGRPMFVIVEYLGAQDIWKDV